MWVTELQIKPSRLCIYDSWKGERSRNGAPKLLGAQLRAARSGISRRSQARMRDAINALVLAAKWKTVWERSTDKKYRFRLSFWTLTLPSAQVHSDSEIVAKCLIPFLADIKRRRPHSLYLWKAETTAAGNLHFHITSNLFYHYSKLQADWNRYTERLGYVSRGTSQNPHSTEIKAVRGVDKLAAYMASYLTKKDTHDKVLQRYLKRYKTQLADKTATVCRLPKRYFAHVKRPVTCAVWNCSNALKKAVATVEYCSKAIAEDVRYLTLQPECWLELERCSIAYLEPDTLKVYRSLYRSFYEQNTALFTSQKGAETFIEVA